jgi:E3 ubiquitin-protein ligase UHRF1
LNAGSICVVQVQSFDQTFENMNKALKTSCLKGLPVRVVRSFKVQRPPFLQRKGNPRQAPGRWCLAGTAH